MPSCRPFAWCLTVRCSSELGRKPLSNALSELLDEVRACKVCAPKLPLGPRPVFQIGAEAKILIAGQAPGRKVHQTGIPFDDPSGNSLRRWLGIDRATFYDPKQVAILPMAFCYPGRGKGGDLPPAAECAQLWRAKLLTSMSKIGLTLVIGRYAQHHHLGKQSKSSLTETVRSYRAYLPHIFPLPHPSPRNGPWLKRNPWFDEDVVPALRDAVARALMEPPTKALKQTP